LFTKRITLDIDKKDDTIYIRPLGDIHLGNLGCDVEKFRRSVSLIAKSDVHYTIGMGDYIDNVMAFANGSVDKRWNPETTDRKILTTEEQTDMFLRYWSPIREKTFGLLAGNHEWKTINQRRFIKDFCEPLGVSYLGRMAYIYLTFRYRKEILSNFLILALHGGYNGLQAGGSVNRLAQIGADFDSDIVLMGHNHDSWVRTGLRVGYNPATDHIYERKIVYANTGTFLRGYKEGVDSYVEINPRTAKRTGTVTIELEPSTGGIYGHD
jgi:hypothetical protein